MQIENNNNFHEKNSYIFCKNVAVIKNRISILQKKFNYLTGLMIVLFLSVCVQFICQIYYLFWNGRFEFLMNILNINLRRKRLNDFKRFSIRLYVSRLILELHIWFFLALAKLFYMQSKETGNRGTSPGKSMEASLISLDIGKIAYQIGLSMLYSGKTTTLKYKK